MRLLRQGEELRAQGVRRLQLSAREIIHPQATQHREQLMGVVQVLAEVSGAGIGLFYLRRRIALGGNQRCPQREAQPQFLLVAFGCSGEYLEEF